jgi:hypothetical protein
MYIFLPVQEALRRHHGVQRIAQVARLDTPD